MCIRDSRWGVAGAAIATAASQFVGGGVPLLYFARPNRSLLRLGKTKLDSRALLKACTNGSSELDVYKRQFLYRPGGGH